MPPRAFHRRQLALIERLKLLPIVLSTSENSFCPRGKRLARRERPGVMRFVRLDLTPMLFTLRRRYLDRRNGSRQRRWIVALARWV